MIPPMELEFKKSFKRYLICRQTIKTKPIWLKDTVCTSNYVKVKNN